MSVKEKFEIRIQNREKHRPKRWRTTSICYLLHKGFNKLHRHDICGAFKLRPNKIRILFFSSLHTQNSIFPNVCVLIQHIDYVPVLEAPVTSLPQPLLSLNPPQQLLSIQIKGWRKSARRHFTLEYEIYSPLGVQ